MVDSKENYKFDLGVKGLTINPLSCGSRGGQMVSALGLGQEI